MLTVAKRKYANQLFSRAPLRRRTLHWQKNQLSSLTFWFFMVAIGAITISWVAPLERSSTKN